VGRWSVTIRDRDLITPDNDSARAAGETSSPALLNRGAPAVGVGKPAYLIEKLVRHRVPQWFEAKGEKCETRVADRSEMLGLLRAKLIEETEELVEAIDSGVQARVTEEAADVFDVVDTIRELVGADRFDEARWAKFHERGTFHQAVVLKLGTPVPMVLLCPKCSGQHVDRGVWSTTRIHRTHLCEHCGETWKPFEYPTVGVEKVEPRVCPICTGAGTCFPGCPTLLPTEAL
jgi:predicted house-cleaning noncanonical NTP pyrophosphatase (MazG superfamily)